MKLKQRPDLDYQYSELQMQDKVFVHDLWHAYANDPFLWITEQVFTVDESLRSNNVRRFPPFKYMQLIIDEYFKNKILYLLKSRRMMATHVFSALWVHQLLFVKHSKNGVISTGRDTAEEFITKRCQKVIEYLDPFFPYPQFRQGKELLKSKITNPDMGDSEIQAFPSRPKNMRGFTFTNCLADEGAFQEYFEDNMDNAIGPAIEGGQARAAAISTPDPLTYFETKTECPPGQTPEQLMGLDWESLPPVVQENCFHFGLSGFYNSENERVLLLHYTADPAKRTAEWYYKTRYGTAPDGTRLQGEKGTRKDKWNREYELSYSVPQGRRVVPEFDRAFHCKGWKGILKDRVIAIGIDFGSIFACISYSQIDDFGRWHIHDSIMIQDMLLKPLLKYAKSWFLKKYPDSKDCEFEYFADPAGDNRDKDGMNADTAKQTAEDILDVDIECSLYSKPCDRARIFQELSGQKVGEHMMLIVNPDGGFVVEKNDKGDEIATTGNIVAAFEKGWTYRKLKPGERYRKDEPPFKDGKYEHIMDSLGYKAIYLFQGLYDEAYRERTGNNREDREEVVVMAGMPRR